MIEIMTLKELSTLLKSGLDKRIAIVDVRTPVEYAKLHIEGSINIPYQLLSFRYEELEPYNTLILYCAAGVRSEIAADEIELWGNKKLFCIKCNQSEWNKANLPLESFT